MSSNGKKLDHFERDKAVIDTGLLAELPLMELRALFFLLAKADNVTGESHWSTDSIQKAICPKSKRRTRAALDALNKRGIAIVVKPGGGRSADGKGRPTYRRVMIPTCPENGHVDTCPDSDSLRARISSPYVPALRQPTCPENGQQSTLSPLCKPIINNKGGGVAADGGDDASRLEGNAAEVFCELKTLGVTATQAKKLATNPSVADIRPLDIRRAYLKLTTTHGVKNPIGILITNLRDGALALKRLGPSELCTLANIGHVLAINGQPLLTPNMISSRNGVWIGDSKTPQFKLSVEDFPAAHFALSDILPDGKGARNQQDGGNRDWGDPPPEENGFVPAHRYDPEGTKKLGEETIAAIKASGAWPECGPPDANGDQRVGREFTDEDRKLLRQ